MSSRLWVNGLYRVQTQTELSTMQNAWQLVKILLAWLFPVRMYQLMGQHKIQYTIQFMAKRTILLRYLKSKAVKSTNNLYSALLGYCRMLFVSRIIIDKTRSVPVDESASGSVLFEPC